MEMWVGFFFQLKKTITIEETDFFSISGLKQLSVSEITSYIVSYLLLTYWS